MEFEIIRAESKHIEKIGILFDLYRQFYSYDSNIKISTQYIRERLTNNESVYIACFVGCTYHCG